MKKVFILLCLILGAQAFCQDSIKLEYKFVPGELLRYKMVMNATLQLDVPSTGKSLSIPVAMAAVVRQRTKRVLPDGNAEIAVAFESIRVQMGDQVRELPAKEIPVATLVMSRSGRVKNLNIPTVDSAQFMGGRMCPVGGFGDYVALPEAVVQVGDSWSQNLPEVPGLGTIRGTGKLISANSKVGKYKAAVVKQSIGGDLNMDMPLALSAQGGSAVPPGMKVNGAFLGDGTIYFSAERGRLIRTDGRVDMQVNVNVPQIAGRDIGNAAATMAMTYEMYLLSAGK